MSQATHEVRRQRGFAVNELVFQVQAPPLGYTTYTVALIQDGPPPAPAQQRAPPVIQNKVRTQKKVQNIQINKQNLLKKELFLFVFVHSSSYK